jgi:putative hemolysin
MSAKQMVFVLFLLAVLVVASCSVRPDATPTMSDSPANLPNPASKNCVDQGYQYEIRAEGDGEVGYCIFPDGSECEEWAFLRGECGPEPSDQGADMANPASKHCTDLGYRLEIRNESGGQVGYCIFPDGSECEEWAFFRGECKPETAP